MKKSPVVGGDMMGFRNPKAAWFEQRQGEKYVRGGSQRTSRLSHFSSQVKGFAF